MKRIQRKEKKKSFVTVLDIWKTIETRRKDIHSRDYSSHIYSQKKTEEEAYLPLGGLL
jgi:hypothetical protein